jgi:hypothetical protein
VRRTGSSSRPYSPTSSSSTVSSVSRTRTAPRKHSTAWLVSSSTTRRASSATGSPPRRCHRDRRGSRLQLFTGDHFFLNSVPTDVVGAIARALDLEPISDFR